MTCGRVLTRFALRDLDGVAASHPAELVRGDFLVSGNRAFHLPPN